jgi:hypothetical protein
MKLPPSLIYFRIKEAGKRGFGFWFPLFLLWPLIIFLVILLFIVTFVADAVMFAIRNPYHRFTRFLWETMLVTFEMRNLRVSVSGQDKKFNLTII